MPLPYDKTNRQKQPTLWSDLHDGSHCSTAHFIKRVNYPDKIKSMILISGLRSGANNWDQQYIIYYQTIAFASQEFNEVVLEAKKF